MQLSENGAFPVRVYVGIKRPINVKFSLKLGFRCFIKYK